MGHGYVQASAGWTNDGGLFGRIEAGQHIATNLALFAYGQLDQLGPSAGVGLRYTW